MAGSRHEKATDEILALTFRHLVLVNFVERIEDCQDLNRAQRVQQMRIVVNVAAEAACKR